MRKGISKRLHIAFQDETSKGLKMKSFVSTVESTSMSSSDWMIHVLVSELDNIEEKKASFFFLVSILETFD